MLTMTSRNENKQAFYKKKKKKKKTVLPTNQITQDNINSAAGTKSFPLAVI